MKKRTLKEHSVQNSKLSHVMVGFGLGLMVTASQGRWRWETDSKIVDLITEKSQT